MRAKLLSRKRKGLNGLRYNVLIRANTKISVQVQRKSLNVELLFT